MDLVDGVDAAAAGGGGGVSLESILEVLVFSGGSSPFRPHAELRAGMLALRLLPEVETKHSYHCRVQTRPNHSTAQDSDRRQNDP
jgi:hypothetical protein